MKNTILQPIAIHISRIVPYCKILLDNIRLSEYVIANAKFSSDDYSTIACYGCGFKTRRHYCMNKTSFDTILCY